MKKLVLIVVAALFMFTAFVSISVTFISAVAEEVAEEAVEEVVAAREKCA